MKSLIPFILFVFITSASFSQQGEHKKTIITGKIIDSVTKAPVDYSSIKVIALDKSILVQTISDTKGSFIIGVDSIKGCSVEISSIGYETKAFTNFGYVNGAGQIDLQLIKLSPLLNQLKEVQIKAVKPMIKQMVDRISYDVQSDPENKVLPALDMLRKVPLVSINAEDKIQIKGNGNYKILINGKPSSLFAADAAQALKGIPSSSIQKIEVITTPPAKYDAEGLGGLINIIMKKPVENGYENYIALSENYPYGPLANLTTTIKQDKLTFSAVGSYFSQKQSDLNAENTLRTTNPLQTTTLQNGKNNFKGNHVIATGELSYEIDTLNLITGNVGYNKYNFNSSSFLNSMVDNETANNVQLYNIKNTGKPNWSGLDIGLNYQLGFRKNKEQFLTFSYKFSDNKDRTNNQVNVQNIQNYLNSEFLQQNNSGSKEHTIQADYIQPGKVISIEAGAKAILRRNFSIYQNEFTGGQESNNFNYTQDVYNVYNSYLFQMKTWSVKAGARLESTAIDYTDVDITRNRNNYLNVIPSVSVQHTFNEYNNFNLGFTQRIRRPGIAELNPFIDQSNPLMISSGNITLRPVLSNNFEFSYSNFKNGSIYVGLTYQFVNNDIQSVTTLSHDTVTNTTYANVGKSKTLTLSMNYSKQLTSKLRLTFDEELSYIRLNGTIGEQFFKNKGLQSDLSVFLDYKINDTWRTNLNFSYTSPEIALQGKSNSYPYSSISVAKLLLNKKLQLFAALKNPYKRYVNSVSYINTADFYQRTVSQSYYRTITITASYSFGKIDSSTKKVERGIENDDIQAVPKKIGAN